MPTGTATAYDLNAGQMLDFDDMIYLLDPFDTPISGGVGAEGGPIIGTTQCFETLVQHLDETLLTPSAVTSATYTAGETTISFSVANSLKFSVGDVFRIESELMRITATNYTTGVHTVSTGFASTSNATHASGTLAVGVGRALPEGSDPGPGRYVDRTARSNYTEIFGPEEVKLSGTEQVVRKYGLNSMTEMDRQIGHRVRDTFGVPWEVTLLYGKQSNDTTNKIRTMDGLISVISTNVDATASSITDTIILTQMQNVFDQGGGGPDMRLVLGSKQARVMSAFTNGTIFTQRGDRGRGVLVDFFDTDFGRVTKVLDRWCRLQDAFCFRPSNVEAAILRPLTMKRLGDTGDSDKVMLVMEKSVRIKGERHMFRCSALT